jgi:hypothetical protein
MTHLVFHIQQHNKWSIFIHYDKHDRVFHVFAKRFNNDTTIFHTTFLGEHTTLCYLDEILKYTRNRPNFSITLFYSDLSIGASFSQYEACVHDRTKEIVGYDYLCLDPGKVLMYLGFVRQDISIEEYE